MKKKKLLFSFFTTLIILVMFTSCASLNSMVNGSKGKYKSSVALWEEGDYIQSLHDMSELVHEDPEYSDASVFIKDNFQLGVDNTINQIKAFESTSTDAFEKTKLI